MNLPQVCSYTPHVLLLPNILVAFAGHIHNPTSTAHLRKKLTS
jgi:hypothetical protein